MHRIGRIVAGAAALSLVVLTAPAAWSADTSAQAAWRRTFTASARAGAVEILEPLPDERVLVRDGAGIVDLDVRGRTVWSEPKIDGLIVASDTVVLRRSDVVFAIRARDAGVLWKRPCANPSYLAAAGDRVLTNCGGNSTVLDAATGAIRSQRTPKKGVMEPPFWKAFALNADYAVVVTTFDGAWLGSSYHVVDAHTGAILWAMTDTYFFDVSPTEVSVAPYPSMLPWSETGTVQRRRLSDGKVLWTDRYAPPREGDTEGRGTLTVTAVAAYVTTSEASYRFARGARTPTPLELPLVQHVEVLGNSAFVFAGVSPGGKAPSTSTGLTGMDSRYASSEASWAGCLRTAATRPTPQRAELASATASR